MAEIRVENIVASASIADHLDLDEVSSALSESEYDPDTFKGVILRIRERGLRTSVLLFNSGKIVCTGAKVIEDIKKTMQYLQDKLSSKGIKVKDEIDFKVQNMVATSDLGGNLNLASVALTLGLERIEYEPEQFPGLVYRMDHPKLVMLFFGSGKIVCTGGTTIEEVNEGVEKVSEELRKTGFLPEKDIN